FHTTKKTLLLIDLGTNGEIALVHKGNILCCSCAAGPAFEGAHIACGTGAVKGAIDHAGIIDGKLAYSTIRNFPASGICGSGLIDLTACLIEEGIISPMGRMSEDYHITENVYLVKKDIREIQLAKAAIAAGIDILISESGISESDIDEVLIAGGFGNFINLENACKIGLLPKSLLSKIRPIGNAAGEGARIALVSKEARANLDMIQSRSRYIELAAHPDFADLYADHLPFESLDE
ncbi:MAG: ATP-binding protein, partial [Clostridia bacterium]|nr:ATP-binding protein [Clostridia bacterium]